MMDIEELLRLDPYSLPRAEKEPMLLEGLKELTKRHYLLCPEYKRVLDRLHRGWESIESAADVPFLPVGLFKGRSLKSIPDEEVFKTLSSSGTTSSQPSRVILDRRAAFRQSQALAQVMAHELGQKRRPMLIIDSHESAMGRGDFSARTAAIRGFSSFGRDHFYALRPDLTIDESGLRDWLDGHAGQPLLAFGFTFLVWRFCQEARALGVDLSKAALIHGGGWKKLQGAAVNRTMFRQGVEESVGISVIRDYYGMIEQIGSVFLECERGVFHSPVFADVAIRNPLNWRPLPPGETGVVQTMSLLPTSYPGHCLLTEDLGTLTGIDDCACGRLGSTFVVEGRVPKAESRGCSDARQYPEASWN